MPRTASGPTCGEAAGQAEGLALEVDAVLDVLERAQGEVEEVAGAAGGVEHAEGLAGVRGRPVRQLAARLVVGAVAAAAEPRGLLAGEGGLDLGLRTSAHSASSGSTMTGFTIFMILSRSV